MARASWVWAKLLCVERCVGILQRFAGCFQDYRDPQRAEHSLQTLISQRVYGIALGYEDLNDHDSLRHDAVMGMLCEKSESQWNGAGEKTRPGQSDRGQEQCLIDWS